MKAYKVLISERARQLLITIIGHVANQNPSSASALKKEILASIETLSQMPECCPLLMSDYIPAKKYRKLVITKRYLAIYQIIEDTVFVEWIVDCKQDYPWLI